MKNFQYTQPNKYNLKDDDTDCVVRAYAISKNVSWETAFRHLSDASIKQHVMFTSNRGIKEIFPTLGFVYMKVSNKKGSKRPTVKEFSLKNPKGTFVLSTAHHMVACVDGHYKDTWDCGEKHLYGIWALSS
jgi:hypothetical protein